MKRLKVVAKAVEAVDEVAREVGREASSSPWFGGQPVIEELQHLRVIDGLALPETTRRPAPASRRVTRAAGNPLSSNNSESDGVSQLLEAAETLAETS